MKSPIWSYLDSGPGHPYTNMAVDEAFMVDDEACGGVLLRLYGWKPPGLSLGYFQPHTEMEDHEAVKKCGAVITRRITGGAAILHIHELTFSVIGNEEQPPFDGDVESSYHRIHQALAKGLADLGIESTLRTNPGSEDAHPSGRARGRCFYTVTGYDLVAGSRKLVGSAQRRSRGRVLHHGSIPLAPNPMTPESADLSTLANRTVSYDETAVAVKRGFEAFFNIRFDEPMKRLPDSIVETSQRLAKEKYGAEVWIKRK